MNRILLVVSAALSLVACVSMPPPPDDWDLWKKSGVTGQDDIKRAMLECGHPMGAEPVDWDDVERSYKAADQKQNKAADQKQNKYIVQSALISRCMEKDGFRYTGEMGTTCSRHPDTPECKLPIEQIPSRDINRRLNGVYCTKFPTAELCKP
jgi:hypothetical protein